MSMSEAEAALSAAMADAGRRQSYYTANAAVPMGTAGPGAHPVDLPVDPAVSGVGVHPLLPGGIQGEPPDVQQPYIPPEPEGGVT